MVQLPPLALHRINFEKDAPSSGSPVLASRRRSDPGKLPSVNGDLPEVSYRRRKSAGDAAHVRSARTHRTVMQDTLLHAIESNNCKAMTARSLGDAREAGVGREVVDEVSRQMQRLEVENMLRRTIDSRNPSIVRVAIQKAKIAGVSDDALLEAHGALRRLEALKKLRMAVESQNPDMICVAISRARDSGLVGEQDIKDAEISMYVFDVRKRLKKLMNGLDVNALHDCLKEARSCLEAQKVSGLAKPLADVVVKADQILVFVRMRAEATEALNAAIGSGGVKQLRFAISIAQHAELDRSDIERAEKVLQQSIAREVLEDALDVRKPRCLEAAIAMAKAASLPEKDVRNAMDALAQSLEEQAARCRKM